MQNQKFFQIFSKFLRNFKNFRGFFMLFETKILEVKVAFLPELGSQTAVETQLQDRQFGKPKYPVLQASQRRPITLGKQGH